jgi:HD superfamily phosphohydrolase
MKFIRDPLYDIIVDDNLLKVVEHYAFQRLRRISQLGLVSYIYPGATHTRFSHSLGVMHLITRAIEIMERKGIKFDNEIKLALKFCALVHDVGHGPFSHALEWAILNIGDYPIYYTYTLKSQTSRKRNKSRGIFKSNCPFCKSKSIGKVRRNFYKCYGMYQQKRYLKRP